MKALLLPPFISALFGKPWKSKNIGSFNHRMPNPQPVNSKKAWKKRGKRPSK